MPYKRRYTKKTVLRKRKSRKGPGGINYNKAVKYAVRGVSLLKTLINTEQKYIDLAPTSLSPTTTGLVTYLSGLAQGNDQDTRTGISIKAVSLFLRGYFLIQVPNGVFTVCRMILVVDNDNQGSTPSFADLMANATVEGQLSQFNGKRFTILKDKVYCLSNAGPKNIAFKVYKKLDFHIRYGGSSASVTSQKDNGIFLFLISNEVTNSPTVNFTSRIRFIDN